MRLLVISTALVFAGFSVAEDKKPEPKGEAVSGKVTLNGQAIPAGMVTFVSKDGKTTVTAVVDEAGAYTATLPVGEYHVAVDNLPAKKADPKNPPKPAPAIPEQYKDPKKTPLVVTVKEGKQNIDIDLKANGADKKEAPKLKGEEVDGKITLDDKPLSEAMVIFVSKDGKTTITALTADDGTYIAILPAGEYSVAVANLPAKPAGPKVPPKPKLLIPEKFGDAKTSGLVIEIVEGKQTFDIALKK
jgi:hypothetical protein